ncbi:porin [Hydrogenophaga sp. BPS33]|uniref:porin n=1 Tax=Hydrogenophaga sp. BPS33 TaxID=2651974 RepID=UPI00131FE4CF|nr:porin [Hydrogenophaga sp. BPS33]QHE88031.1 porin [Hydrogenophaga sp. BPS33]
MKKSLIALAILGSVAGVAQAQSSVTLYGLADVWVGRQKIDFPGVGSTSVTGVNSGGLATSRFGLQGTEDLGGGLKAIFKLEQGFNADTGTAQVGGTAFERQSWVGLEGGFGTVQFGNIWSAFDDVYAIGNSVFDSLAFSPSYGTLSVAAYVDKPRNGMRYTSPSFGGVSFAVSHSLDEVAGVSNDQTDFNVQYAGGPLTVAFAYQLLNDAVAVGTDAKAMYLTGSYDFGVAVLKGGVGQTRNFFDTKTKDWQIGADFPLSSALTLSTGYARSKDEPTDFKRTAFSVGALYTLSKRTATYAGFKRQKGEDAAGTTTARVTTFGVGLQHKF